MCSGLHLALIIDFISDRVSGRFGSPRLHNGFSTLSANSDAVTQTVRPRSNRKNEPVPQSGRLGLSGFQNLPQNQHIFVEDSFSRLQYKTTVSTDN